MAFFEDINRLSKVRHNFCVPAHKGRGDTHDTYRLDVTEHPLSDNAAHPTGALRDSERLASELFGSGDTLYCTAGSSTAIKAAIAAHCGFGGTLLVSLPVHRSVADAAVLFDLQLHFLNSHDNHLSPTELDTALQKSGAKAVLFTYTDYEGRILNLQELTPICRAHGAAVIVDNAHGAYFKFLSRDFCIAHPLDLGADVTVDSAYKTLGALTPAALLHLKKTTDTARVRRLINTLSTTSPPYPVMYSLDVTMRAIADGRYNFDISAHRMTELKRRYSDFLLPNDEPTKLVFSPKVTGLTPFEIYNLLFAENILPELCDELRVLFVASHSNTLQDFKALDKALSRLLKHKYVVLEQFEQPPVDMRCSPAKAVHTAHAVAIDDAVGHICGEVVAPCPPGTVIMFPGQVITRQQVQLAKVYGVGEVYVAQNPSAAAAAVANAICRL